MTPESIALLTGFKEPEKDYSWYVEKGSSLLCDHIKRIYYTLISDRQGESPRLLLMAQANRIILLLGNMATDRRDYANRVIYDTLYLEFGTQGHHAVLSAAAALLDAYDADEDHSQYREYEQTFRNYAENLLEDGKAKELETIPPIALPQGENIGIGESHFVSSEAAVRSMPETRRKCARYLQQLAEQERLPESLLAVSTGRVNKEQLQEFADKRSGGELVILTLSDSVQGEIDLRSTTEKYLPQNLQQPLETLRKHVPKKLPWISSVLIIGFVFLLFLLTRDRVSPQLAALEIFGETNKVTELSFNSTPSPPVQLPRQGNAFTFVLQFNEAMDADKSPQIRLANGGDPKAITPGSCAAQNEKRWECGLTTTTGDPNQELAFALHIQEAQDKAGNSMDPVTLNFTLETLEMEVALRSLIQFLSPAGTLNAQISVAVRGKYEITEVYVNNVKAEQGQQPDVWEAVIPLESFVQPITAVIRDGYGNEFKTIIFS